MSITTKNKSESEKQHELRLKVVRLREKNMTVQEVSEKTGVCLSHVSTIWQKYKRGGGFDALEPKRKGRKCGEQRKLTASQEKEVLNFIIGKTPIRIGLPEKLWTRDVLCEAIKKELGIELAVRTITDYLKRWGITPISPPKRASKNNPAPYNRWVKSAYPDELQNAKKNNRVIYWGDMITIQIDSNGVKKAQKDIKLISAISNHGDKYFLLYRNDITETKFIRFLQRLISDTGKKIRFIMYNHEVFQNEGVHHWLDKNRKKIDVLYLEDCYLSGVEV